jgi:hypothetical protein
VDGDDRDAGYAAGLGQQMKTLPKRAEAACPGYRPTLFASGVRRHGAGRRVPLSSGDVQIHALVVLLSMMPPGDLGRGEAIAGDRRRSVPRALRGDHVPAC